MQESTTGLSLGTKFEENIYIVKETYSERKVS